MKVMGLNPGYLVKVFKIIPNYEWTHCLDLILNGLLTRRNFWRIPGMLGNYTIPKWKEFLKSREPILRKSYLSTFIHINKHMDGARDTFWIKSLNGTFLALQIKAFGPKNFWFSCMGKKVPFWQVFRIHTMIAIRPPTSTSDFCLGFLWIPRKTGRQNWRGPIF